jgi:hypothetical protein
MIMVKRQALLRFGVAGFVLLGICLAMSESADAGTAPAREAGTPAALVPTPDEANPGPDRATAKSPRPEAPRASVPGTVVVDEYVDIDVTGIDLSREILKRLLESSGEHKKVRLWVRVLVSEVTGEVQVVDHAILDATTSQFVRVETTPGSPDVIRIITDTIEARVDLSRIPKRARGGRQEPASHSDCSLGLAVALFYKRYESILVGGVEVPPPAGPQGAGKKQAAEMHVLATQTKELALRAVTAPCACRSEGHEATQVAAPPDTHPHHGESPCRGPDD